MVLVYASWRVLLPKRIVNDPWLLGRLGFRTGGCGTNVRDLQLDGMQVAPSSIFYRAVFDGKELWK